MSSQRNGDDATVDPGMVRIRQRLRALRSRYAGTALSTELTHFHDDQVVVRAALALPDGTGVTAYAAEPIDDTGMLDGAIELAEQRAIARALDLLGVGDFGGEGRRAAAPERRPGPAEEGPAEEAPDEAPVAPAQHLVTDEAAAGEPAGAVETEASAPPAAEDEPDLADYTWTHLWSWARAHGLTNRSQVEERIGRPISGLGPREIRQLLMEAGIPE